MVSFNTGHPGNRMDKVLITSQVTAEVSVIKLCLG